MKKEGRRWGESFIRPGVHSGTILNEPPGDREDLSGIITWAITRIAPTVLLLLVASSALAADLRLGGYLKSLDIYAQSPPQSDLPSGEISSNRLRLDLTGSAGPGVDFELSGENQLLYTDPAGLLPLPGESVNRAVDLAKSWNEGGRFQNRLFVDRLNLRATRAGIEWTVGRQAIGFGRIVLFSPLDIIAPFPPDALDTDVRPGVDALRAVHYYGLGGQVGAVAVFGDTAGNDSFLATFSHHLRGVDLLGIAGRLRRRPMAGFGLATSLGGMGVKAEAAFFEGRRVGEPGGDLHDDLLIAGLEGDYRFDSGLILTAEYLYNGAGADEPADYPEVLASAPAKEGLSFLAGRHYLLAGPSWEVHPLVTFGATLIWNIEDDSFFLRPLVDLSLSDNLALQIFWAFSRGGEPEEVLGFSVPRSEFGSAGDSGGFFLKYYF